MILKEAIAEVNEYLIKTGLDADSPTVRKLAYIAEGIALLQDDREIQNDLIEKQRSKINSLENIDEIAGQYRDLAEEAINEFSSHVESGSSIDYGIADKLRNKLEELKG